MSDEHEERSVLQKNHPNGEEAVGAAETAKAAADFIKSIIIATTYSDTEALETVENIYADNILYFGELKSKAEVYSDKLKYVRRWPFRSVSLRSDTITASCGLFRCKVTGIYDWGVGNAKGHKKAGQLSSFMSLR